MPDLCLAVAIPVAGDRYAACCAKSIFPVDRAAVPFAIPVVVEAPDAAGPGLEIPDLGRSVIVPVSGYRYAACCPKYINPVDDTAIPSAVPAGIEMPDALFIDTNVILN